MHSQVLVVHPRGAPRVNSAGVGMLLTLVACAVHGADPVQPILADLTQANQARAAQASEAAEWDRERQRLNALITATRSETARLEREALIAETARDAALAAAAAPGPSQELAQAQATLNQAAVRLDDHLHQVAATLPPGVLPTSATGGSHFDQVAIAIDAAERSANGVAVEVVTGFPDGSTAPMAVKLLRVAGAAAWWVALDGHNAGTATWDADRLLLATADTADQAAIRHALAQVENREPAEVVSLPLAAPITLPAGKGQP